MTISCPQSSKIEKMDDHFTNESYEENDGLSQKLFKNDNQADRKVDKT